MDESAAAAAASKKKPSSSRLAGRHRSRSNGWSNRRPPERLDWPTISSVGVSANNAATATAATTVAVRQGKLVAAAAAAAASSQESFSSSPPPPPKSKRQRHNHHWVHHHHSTQPSSTLSQQSTSPPPPRRRGGISSTSSNSNYTNDNTSSSTIIHINNNNSNNNTNALWTEKYAPQQPSDLVVASKKVEQVSSWIQNALGQGTGGTSTTQQRLLVLVGSPGIGKSAMIHCLAARQQDGLGFNVLEWTESFATRTNETWQQQQQNNSAGFMAVEQPSPINSFEAFLQQAAVGYSPLTMQTSSQPASTALSQQQQQSKRTISSLSQPQRKTAPSSSSNNINNNSGHSRSVILLDELPYCHDDEAKNKFRNLLSNHIENSILPCILIFSNVLEGKHKPEDLEALIDARVLYSPNMTTIVQIHAATKARLKRTLQHICQQEGIVAGTATKHHQQQQEYNLFQDLHFRSGGDVRFAITTLQYEYACNNHHHNSTLNSGNGTTSTAAKKKKNTAKTACANESERDQKLSMFHALGKLLYAKRHEQNSIASSSNNQASDAGDDKYNHHRAPLTFDPERVVEHCGIEVAGALSFLGYHSLDFYTDVEELSQAWDLFSDATYWLDRPTVDGSWYKSSSSSCATSYSAFPVGYASSLAGRAVASTNLHPAPHKFRQFSAPPVFEVMRKRRDNTSLIRHFQSRFDMLTMSNNNNISSSSHAVSGLSHSHPNELATDLAYLRMILPPEAASASQLQSHFGLVPAQQRRQQEEQETAAALLKEQEQVLRDDDIMDFDDDDNNNQSDEVITTNKLTAGRGVMSLGTENNKPSPTSSTDNIPVSSAMVKMRFK